MPLLYKIFARSEEVEGDLAEIVRPHLDISIQLRRWQVEAAAILEAREYSR
jgi:hypothetical protein